MTQEPASPVKDESYDLITVLQVLLRSVWKIETYAKDAEEEGGSELARWFRKIQDYDRAAAAEGKQLLLRRLQEEAADPRSAHPRGRPCSLTCAVRDRVRATAATKHESWPSAKKGAIVDVATEAEPYGRTGPCRGGRNGRGKPNLVGAPGVRGDDRQPPGRHRRAAAASSRSTLSRPSPTS